VNRLSVIHLPEYQSVGVRMYACTLLTQITPRKMVIHFQNLKILFQIFHFLLH